MDNYRIIKPEVNGCFAGALESVAGQLEAFLAAEATEGRKPVRIQFFLSDAQNQAAALQTRLLPASFLSSPKEGSARKAPDIRSFSDRISIIEQPPLDGSRVAALVHTSTDADRFTFHSLRLTEEEAAGKNSYEQSRILFAKYLAIIKPLGLELKTHCVRTWIYVRDIDSNYAGMVRARNGVFAEEGLSHETHYIASTGIGGATEGRNALVAMDFLTCPGIAEEDKTYLKALSHLSPTHDYGVAFERGVMLGGGRPEAAGHIFISGTASIDHRGNILHEGDVLAQTDRLLENIEALMAEGLQDGRVPYFVIYLRDISDYAKVDAYMQERYPDIPRLILEARVCRPGWLIEMECESLTADAGVPFSGTPGSKTGVF